MIGGQLSNAAVVPLGQQYPPVAVPTKSPMKGRPVWETAVHPILVSMAILIESGGEQENLLATQNPTVITGYRQKRRCIHQPLSKTFMSGTNCCVALAKISVFGVSSFGRASPLKIILIGPILVYSFIKGTRSVSTLTFHIIVTAIANTSKPFGFCRGNERIALLFCPQTLAFFV